MVLEFPCGVPLDLDSSLRGFFLASFAGLAESLLAGWPVFEGVGVPVCGPLLGFPSFGGPLFPGACLGLGCPAEEDGFPFACCPFFASPPPVAEDHAEVADCFHCLPVAFPSDHM